MLSPHPHARIVSIDLSAALAADGVAAVVTAKDIPGKNDIAPIRTDEPLLAAGLVEHEGQIIAAVAAATLDQARAAAKLVKVEYEVLPPVLTVEEAVAQGTLCRAGPEDGARRHRRGAEIRAASAVRRIPLRRTGSLLSRGPDRDCDARRDQSRYPCLLLDPASDRGAARRRACARHPVQRGDGGGAPHGRRLRRQGKPADHHRRHRRAARRQDAQARQAAAAARRRHARHRQAPSVLLSATTSASTTTARSAVSTFCSRPMAAMSPTTRPRC